MASFASQVRWGVLTVGSAVMLSAAIGFLPKILVLAAVAAVAVTWVLVVYPAAVTLVVFLLPLGTALAPTRGEQVRALAVLLLGAVTAWIYLRPHRDERILWERVRQPLGRVAAFSFCAVLLTNSVRGSSSIGPATLLGLAATAVAAYFWGRSSSSDSGGAGTPGAMAIVALVPYVVTTIPTQLEALADPYRHSTYIPRGGGAFNEALGSANLAGAILMFLALLALGFRMRGAVATMIWSLVVPMSVLALFLTYSRRAWFGFLAGGIAFVLARRKIQKKWLVGACAIACVVIAVAASNEVVRSDLRERVGTYGYGVEARSSELDALRGLRGWEWFLGGGAGSAVQPGPDGRPIFIHNSYVVVLVDFGFVGLASLLVALFSALGSLWKKGKDSVPAAAGLAALVSAMIAGLGGEMLLYGVLFAPVWFLIGTSHAPDPAMRHAAPAGAPAT